VITTYLRLALRNNPGRVEPDNDFRVGLVSSHSYSPVPEREMDWASTAPQFGALSVKISVAARAPLALGENVTATVQLNDGATPEPQVFVCEKSPEFDPVMLTLVMFRVSLPVLVTVTFAGALLVPTA